MRARTQIPRAPRILAAFLLGVLITAPACAAAPASPPDPWLRLEKFRIRVGEPSDVRWKRRDIWRAYGPSWPSRRSVEYLGIPGKSAVYVYPHFRKSLSEGPSIAVRYEWQGQAEIEIGIDETSMYVRDVRKDKRLFTAIDLSKPAAREQLAKLPAGEQVVNVFVSNEKELADALKYFSKLPKTKHRHGLALGWFTPPRFELPTNVDSLTLSGCDLRNVDCRLLGDIRHLSVSDSENFDVEFLRTCESLQTLELSEMRRMKHFRELDKAWQISRLWMETPTDEKPETALECVKELRQLESLDLSLDPRGEMKVSLDGLENLRALAVSGREEYDFTSLAKCGHLYYLDLKRRTIQEYATIPPLPTLRLLRISASYQLQSLPVLGKMPKLKYLDVHETDIPSEDVPRTPTLEYVLESVWPGRHVIASNASGPPEEDRSPPKRKPPRRETGERADSASVSPDPWLRIEKLHIREHKALDANWGVENLWRLKSVPGRQMPADYLGVPHKSGIYVHRPGEHVDAFWGGPSMVARYEWTGEAAIEISSDSTSVSLKDAQTDKILFTAVELAKPGATKRLSQVNLDEQTVALFVTSEAEHDLALSYFTKAGRTRQRHGLSLANFTLPRIELPPNVDSLEIYRCEMQHIDCHLLKNIRYLSLVDSENLDMAGLRDCKSLSTLELVSLRPNRLHELAELQQIEHLRLAAIWGVKPERLVGYVKELVQLQRLDLELDPPPRGEISQDQFPNLRQLGVSSCAKYDFTSLGHMEHLYFLDLEEYEAHDLAGIPELPALRFLRLTGRYNLESFPVRSKLPKLEYLDIAYTDIATKSLPELPSLRYVVEPYVRGKSKDAGGEKEEAKEEESR